jgi:RND family efflux transporter MFP subunit
MNRKTKGTLLLSALVITALALSGCGNKAEEVNEPVIKKQVEVQYITKQSEVNSSLLVSGTVTPKQYSVVRSLTPGTIEYLAPVGSQIVVGQPLFSIRDEGIESGYFNARQSLDQTNIVTGQRIQQAELGLNSSKARYDLAQSQYDNTIAQTEQALRTAEDSAVVAYSSAYNTLRQVYLFLNKTSDLQEKEYIYQDLLTLQGQLKSATWLDFNNSLNHFNDDVVATVSVNNLDANIPDLQESLFLTKEVVDNTVVLLQGGVDSTLFSGIRIETDKSSMINYQLQINQHVTGIIAAINSVNNTKITNQLSTDLAQNQLRLSEIEYNNAEISLQNAKDGAGLERSMSQTQFDGAAYSYNNLTLASPFSGTIMSHYASPGEQATIGQQMIELGDLSIVEMTVDVDVDFAAALTLNDDVMINEEYKGAVIEIEPVGDLNSGKISVTVQSSEAETTLVAGDIADIKFNLKYQDLDTIVIPIKSVTIEASGSYVFVIEEEVVARKSVTLGQVFGDKVSVVSGLSENDQLILLNGVFVAIGDEVEIVNK